MKIIGLGHRRRVGKNTAARFIFTFLRTERKINHILKTAFADKLKAQCHELYSWAGLQPGEYYEQEIHEDERYIPLPVIGKTPVEIWIQYGTTVCRAIYGETWIAYLLNKPRVDTLIVSDVRFPNEASMILNAGGAIIKIENERAPISNDVADTALLDWNDWSAVVQNNGTLSQFHDDMISTIKSLGF